MLFFKHHLISVSIYPTTEELPCSDEIGSIKQQQLLDLFLEQLAPIVYNKALDDAMRWYQTMQGNMESDYYLLYKD